MGNWQLVREGDCVLVVLDVAARHVTCIICDNVPVWLLPRNMERGRLSRIQATAHSPFGRSLRTTSWWGGEESLGPPSTALDGPASHGKQLYVMDWTRDGPEPRSHLFVHRQPVHVRPGRASSLVYSAPGKYPTLSCLQCCDVLGSAAGVRAPLSASAHCPSRASASAATPDTCPSRPSPRRPHPRVPGRAYREAGRRAGAGRAERGPGGAERGRGNREGGRPGFPAGMASSNGTENGEITKIKAKPRIERNRVLVTGGAGFVGSHLCTYLVERGDHVSSHVSPPSLHVCAPGLRLLIHPAAPGYLLGQLLHRLQEQCGSLDR